MAEEMMLLRAFPGIDHAAVGVIISNSTLLRVDGIGEAVVVEVGIIRRSSQRNLRFQHLDRPGPVEMTKPAAAVRQVCAALEVDTLRATCFVMERFQHPSLPGA